MPGNKKIFFFLLTLSVACLTVLNNGCGVYKFKDVNIDPNIKTVKVNAILNRARFVNPQLAPQLTDKLRQKIVNQTKLSQTNNDDAHLEITGYVSKYDVTTSGISNQQVSTSRLNVEVHITLFNHLKNTQEEFDVSHAFDFSSGITLAQAEAQLTPKIIRNMTDEVFNHIFSKW